MATDPDTMTLREAIQQPDKCYFLEAMKREISDHISHKHWKVVPAKSIPRHKYSIPMVWSIKRKRDIIGEITNWKICMCAGGHQSKKFVDYWEIYSPVVYWQTIRLVFVLAIANRWHINSVNFSWLIHKLT